MGRAAPQLEAPNRRHPRQRLLWPRPGLRDVNKPTNIAFWLRHPELAGTKLRRAPELQEKVGAAARSVKG